jgi:Fe-S oxidoreductase
VEYDRERAVREITALIEGRDADILRQCITCVACNEYCPTGASPFDLILKLQEKTGALPALQANVPRMAQGIASMPSQVVKGSPGKPVLSLCVAEPVMPPGTIEGQLFEGLTLLKGGEYFCLIGYVHSAVESPIRENAARFVENLSKVGTKEIVFLHDDCYAMLTNKVKDYGIEVPFRPVHIFEYLLTYLKEHRKNITKVGKTVAYQRPCASRYTPEKDAMLDELFELIGVERPVRKYERENALCCSGPVVRLDRERALKIQDMNLTDAKGTGAEAMIFLCPWCLRTLGEASRQRGLAPILITDLCRVALGEKPFP